MTEKSVSAVVDDLIANPLNNKKAEVPAQPPRLTTEERLTIENLFLKLQNAQHQVQQLDQNKAALIDQMRQLQTEMEAQRAALSEKYGIDISRTTVKADGTIVYPVS